jgi:hypothetical protein
MKISLRRMGSLREAVLVSEALFLTPVTLSDDALVLGIGGMPIPAQTPPAFLPRGQAFAF